MHKSKIEWCDATWNPVTGCRHGCEYCYAKAMVTRFAGEYRKNLLAKSDYKTESAPDGSGELYILDKPMRTENGEVIIYPFRFEPTLHRYRIDKLEEAKSGRNIFVGAMSDIFGTWVPDSWIEEIFEACRKNRLHNYLFLTKNPARYQNIELPKSCNMWYGTSVTCETDMGRINCLPKDCNAFVSIEPLRGNVLANEHKTLIKEHVNWIIVGAQTGSAKDKITPDFTWVRDIVTAADSCAIPVFMKDSMIPIVGEKNMRRDFPDKLKIKKMSRKKEEMLCHTCGCCGARQLKRDMYTVGAKKGRTSMNTIGFLCDRCFYRMCSEYGQDPKLAKEYSNGKQ